MPFTSPPLTRSLLRQWALRDKIAAAALFFATAAIALWQNAHVAALWDISYTLDSSWRIALGQMPYRDFPFVHAPLPFLIQAAIIRLTGRVFFHHVIYAAFVGGMGTVLTWRIALHTLSARVQPAWTIALLLSAPLIVLGLYCIVPHPSYDCDCAFSILVAVWLLQRLAPNENDPSRQPPGFLSGFAAGVAICLPLFFKQNMGLPFLLAAFLSVALVLLLDLSKCAPAKTGQASPTQPLPAVLIGAVATLTCAALLIHCTFGLGNYIHWTIVFAGQRRLPGWAQMLSVYSDTTLLWTVPCVVAALLLLRLKFGKPRLQFAVALALFAAPFIYALSSLYLYDDGDERGDSLLALWPLLLILAVALVLWNLFARRRNLTLHSLMPFILLAAIHGTFLSQQLWGSTYAIWPLLSLLLADLIAFLATLVSGPQWGNPGKLAETWLPTTVAALIAATLFICGSFYTVSEERLSYDDFPAGPVLHSAFPALAGLSTPGPYLPELDELLRYAAANIPVNDGLVLLPGEDPFYFATGREPQFPVLLFDPATDPYSPAEVVSLIRFRNIRWLIIKHHLQIQTNPMPQPQATLAALQTIFALHAQLRGYDIYLRR